MPKVWVWSKDGECNLVAPAKPLRNLVSIGARAPISANAPPLSFFRRHQLHNHLHGLAADLTRERDSLIV